MYDVDICHYIQILKDINTIARLLNHDIVNNKLKILNQFEVSCIHQLCSYLHHGFLGLS
ncbi:hypothetical protein [Methanobrevibacter sp.]|uniref:hypothetical protein n=1 Tax=Methanobrevibacter sp. TaxID=66852 RepID=UPI0026DFE4DA|nr:hypothetical protein [Methanobrevibacter sp.]MDO5823698.1 hypothetical protein [Methanobrevibacter sp.]